MKIVVLDGFALNPGDLSWDGLKKFGDLTVYDRTPEDDILNRAGDAEIVLTNKTPLTAAALNKLSSLRYIGVLATGYNIVDIDAAKKHNVIGTNVPGYSTDSVVQLTFALLLELTHHVQRHSDAVMKGRWAKSLDFCFWDYPLIELSGKTMGIIGLGSIGRNVANVAVALGMNIIGNSRRRVNPPDYPNFRWMEVHDLLQNSDVVSLHCPLTPLTKGLINTESLNLMKRSAFLLNTSRGSLIVEEDLAEALNNNVISGAGIDVLASEPPSDDNPLFGVKNCIITPHIAWASKESRRRLIEVACTNISAFLSGSPTNTIN